MKHLCAVKINSYSLIHGPSKSCYENRCSRELNVIKTSVCSITKELRLIQGCSRYSPKKELVVTEKEAGPMQLPFTSRGQNNLICIQVGKGSDTKLLELAPILTRAIWRSSQNIAFPKSDGIRNTCEVTQSGLSCGNLRHFHRLEPKPGNY